jgi:prepilin-type N-terminal cleavage/methylation domain-containing protein
MHGRLFLPRWTANNKNEMKVKNNLNSKQGFTILEIIVVIFIITLGMVGVLSLVHQNIQVEYVNKNTIIASQLSQEGLELVRNKRDTNWLNGVNWELSANPFTNSDILQDGSYTIDYTGAINRIPDNIDDAGTELYLDANGFYVNSSSASSTLFSRIITVGNESVASTSVTCLVQWKKGTRVYSFSAQTVLYNWR